MGIPKFRAWHKENKFMFDVRFLNLEDKLVDRSQFSFDEIELMQWTGLQDYNGDDIYAGDIVSSDCDEGTLYEKVVRLSSGLYMLECIFSGEQHTDLESCKDSVEVVGNIYENSELLKP